MVTVQALSGLRLCLAGASTSNGNRGVEALGRAVLGSIDHETDRAQVTVFDDGWGVRPERSQKYRSALVEYVGVRVSRRWHRPESWVQIGLAQRVWPRVNPAARRIAATDAVLDISGGDSFTDLYGPFRLRQVTAPKAAAARAGRPLVLLPQTFGPFTTVEGREIAERVVRSATLAYARDAASYAHLHELADDRVEPGRLREGVDVAFALEAKRPMGTVADVLDSVDGVVAGVNVSGLLKDRDARERFDLAGDYLSTITDLVAKLVSMGTTVLLTPHVHTPGADGESDAAAIAEVRRAIPEWMHNRIVELPANLTAAELKWCIAQCDWFAGSRMHATIAALSSQVPAVGYAYSDKTSGVFETCGMAEYVYDAREISGPEAVEAMVAAFEKRDSVRMVLRENIPSVVGRARTQLRDVLTEIASWKGR